MSSETPSNVTCVVDKKPFDLHIRENQRMRTDGIVSEQEYHSYKEKSQAHTKTYTLMHSESLQQQAKCIENQGHCVYKSVKYLKPVHYNKIAFISLPKAEFLIFSEPTNVAKLLGQLEVLVVYWLFSEVPPRCCSEKRRSARRFSLDVDTSLHYRHYVTSSLKS